MGVVYRATDVRLGRPVALKLLSDELSRDASFRARFERESRLAAAIDHAHIVPVYEAGSARGLLFLAMRYVDGGDLAEVLRGEGQLEPGRALALVDQLASALDAAHERGLIHRDVKPSNALIARESGREHVYLADFGLTKSAGSHSLTGTGQVMGTVLYMAPEVIRGEDPTAAADQYALGCVLYECLTGHVPYEGANEAAVIYGHLETPPPGPSERVPGLPRELDAAVQRALAKDPSARWPTCTALVDAVRAALDAGPAPAIRRRALPRRHLLVALAVAALAVLGAMLLRGDDGANLVALGSNAVAVIDPGGKLQGQVDVEGTPGRVAAAGEAIWVSDDDRGTVSRLDPETHTVRQTISVGHGPSALAADRDGVWVANRQDGTLLQIAASTNEVVTGPMKLASAPSDVCLAGGSVWIAAPAARQVLRVAGDGTRRRPVRLEVQPDRLACGEGAVWASSEAEGRVVQINSTSARAVRTIDVGVGAGALAAGDGVWVTNPLTGIVSRIDPERGVVTATVPVGKDDAPSEIAVGAGGVWVANLQGATVARIAPGRARKLKLGNPPRGLATVDGALWIAVSRSGTAHRGGTLRQLGLGNTPLLDTDTDPAASYGDPTLTSATRDGLMAFRRDGSGPYGAVIPNLAATLPEVSDAGRTYTFTIRRDIRFSDGRAVRPSDVADSLNRAVGPGVLATQVLDTVRRAEADDAAGTVTVELSRPDPEILFKLATSFGSVVPRGSGKPPARRVLPGTGPYRLAGLDPKGGFRLERNPYFKVWSAAARPDGYPDAIVVKYMKTDRAEAAVRAVATGAADHVDLPLVAQATDLLPKLRRRHGDRLHAYVPAGLQWVWFNVDSPPFNRLDARRAVGYALDRRAVLRALGGADVARLTCRIIPPDLAGHEPGPCPYPDRPDLATARRLVRESGTRGMRVTVLSGHPAFTGVMKVVVNALREIGYRPTFRSQPIDKFFRGLTRPRHDGDIGPFGWFADYPAASNFFLPLFKCGRPPATTNVGHYCDARLDALIRQAQDLQIIRPAQASRLWAAADSRVIEQAAAVPLSNGVHHDFVSERVGNFKSNLLFGSSVDQWWVR